MLDSARAALCHRFCSLSLWTEFLGAVRERRVSAMVAARSRLCFLRTMWSCWLHRIKTCSVHWGGLQPSTSSGEVKENRDTRNLDSGAVGPRCFQSFRSAGGTFGRERMQPLEGGAGSGRLLQLQLVCRKHSWSVSPKNALVHLNELRPGLKYRTLSQRGPRHAPVFSVTVEVDGVAFQGTGATKKKAKMRAAELALGSFVQFPNAPQALFTMGALGPTSVDFTSDRATDLLGALFKGFEPGHGDGKLDHLPPDLAVCSHWGQGAEPGLREHRSPVALLNELRPGLRYLCLPRGAEGGRVRRSFVMALTVDGRTFEGSGRSKKLAKNQAALSALRDLFAGALPPEWSTIHKLDRKCPLLPQVSMVAVSRLVAEKYSELAVRWSPLHACPRVLAGIVMTRGMDIRHAEVIAIATGTKCLNGEYMSDQGLVVNDCHAEVVVRRAFVRFLYSQLELFLSKQQEDWQRSIFIPHEDKGYRLHSDVRFHMYVSSSPCGDARLNSPYETTADSHRLLHLARRSHSHLRTKIECGEGTVPVRCCHAAQTWDGVLQGEPLATMSCTDKMARWNVLGLQGALLTHLVEPVYLYSLTVGSLQHVGHLSRAVAHRLGGLGGLGRLCRGRPYHPGKSPGTSVNWTAGDAQPEVLNATTGTRMASGSPSRLCKRALFTRWAKLVHRVSPQSTRHLNRIASTPLPYCQAKRAAEVYQAVKQRWVSALREAGLGTWVRKPPEQDHFLLCV
uniref:Adenosine deaminase RNA specific B2 (inactive) n=1 Tax=Scleropages formosus TaxID=113540 RepID=A0A8C9QYT9_SCLFO